LRALQAEDLRAEVIGPVRVAKATARDHAAAQVDALDAGRVHVDLEHRARTRHVLDERALDLDRDRVAAAGPVVVRAARRLEQVDEVAEDQVLLDDGDALEHLLVLRREWREQLLGALRR
jgi:hypothetical protein